MKFNKIFNTDFWKTFLGSKEESVGIPKDTLSPENGQQEILTSQLPNTSLEIPTGSENKTLTVRSELNLEQNAVFTVSNHKGKSREIIIEDTANGIKRQVIIGKTIDGIETGILTTYHFKLYLALLEIWENAGRPTDKSVHFTILQVIKRLGIADAGTNYERIKRQLINLSQIPLTFVDSFYQSDEESFHSLKPFQILSYLDIYERKYSTRKSGQMIRGYGEFRFHDNILSSLVNNYSHPLRLDVITGFRKHRDIAILLYTYLDRQLAFRDKYEIGLEKLFDHLDLSQKQIRYPAARKLKLDPVLEQIRGKELSTGILSFARVDKTKDRKDYKLVCHKRPFPKKPKGQEEYQPELNLWDNVEIPGDKSEKPEITEQNSGLLPLLIEKGLTQKQASKLIEEKEPDVISDQITYLPFRLKEYKAQGKEINEAAILYESINDNWSAPKGHLGVEKEKDREAEQIEREKIARLEQGERDKTEQERVRMEAYKETLNPDERAKLRERALELIRGIEGINEQFINEPLIMSKENEILKSE